DRRGGTAARTASRAAHVPRIAACAEGLRLSGRCETEFRCVGLAERDEPCGFEFLCEIGIDGRDETGVAKEAHPAVKRIACGGADQVLEKEGDPAKRTIGNRAVLRLRARLVEKRRDD